MRFPQLEQQIGAVIAEYGLAFPKLNWSAPRVRECYHQQRVEAHRTQRGYLWTGACAAARRVRCSCS